MVSPRQLVAALLASHDEDVARLGGYLAQTDRARSAAEERVSRRLWHRLPWLVVGLVGAMVSAIILGGFEEELSSEILLSFFVPAVVYMSGAVGTQTITVLVRGLSVGVDLRRVVLGELVTGAVVGLLIAVVFFPFALLLWGEADVAAAVALALFASCAAATLVAMALPFGFQRLGLDPAFGSGPLVTVIQDLLSIAVYLGIATALVV
jgi:magnesium transporter